MSEGRTWRKSSFSNSNGECVEVSAFDGTVLVRDSKDPDGNVLFFGLKEWEAFINGVRQGEFDYEL